MSKKTVPIESIAESPFKGKKTHLALDEIDPEEGYHISHYSDSDKELLFTKQGGYFDLDREEQNSDGEEGIGGGGVHIVEDDDKNEGGDKEMVDEFSHPDFRKFVRETTNVYEDEENIEEA